MDDQIVVDEEFDRYGPWGQDGVPENITRLVLDWFSRAYEQFCQHKQYQKLTAIEKRYAYASCRSFVAMMLIEIGETPAEWSREGLQFALDELITHDMPQIQDYDNSYIKCVMSFMKFLSDTGALSQAPAMVTWLKPYLENGHERCDCGIRTDDLEMADRVMSQTGLRPEKLMDRAVFISKYTEMVCEELEKRNDPEPIFETPPETSGSAVQVNVMLCACGSGKPYDQCCSGVN